MSAPLDCPSCGADNRAGVIPEDRRELYGGKEFFSRVMGVEIPGVYDGVLFWEYPCCGHLMNRWPEGHHLHERAQQRMNVWEWR